MISDHGCHVYLGARNPERGTEAVQAIKDHVNDPNAPVELVVVDVADDSSVQQAAESLLQRGVKLNALVNNAGQGFATSASPAETLNVNFMGTKRAVDNFLPLLEKDGKSRIVNVGSGGGCGYVSDQNVERQQRLCSSDITWDEIFDLYQNGLDSCSRGGYGLSKALVHSYTMFLAREHPEVLSYCLSPGFVQTAMTKGSSAKLMPEEGTKSLIHCLFHAKTEQTGWFFGSDCQRSPLHFMRNPPMPAFDGVYPWQTVPELVEA